MGEFSCSSMGEDCADVATDGDVGNGVREVWSSCACAPSPSAARSRVSLRVLRQSRVWPPAAALLCAFNWVYNRAYRDHFSGSALLSGTESLSSSPPLDTLELPVDPTHARAHQALEERWIVLRGHPTFGTTCAPVDEDVDSVTVR